MNPSAFWGSSMVHKAVQDQSLMKGGFEGITGSTRWMPGCLRANVAFAAALESPAAKWCNC